MSTLIDNLKRSIDVIIHQKVDTLGELFHKWFEYLTPMHKLSAKERLIASYIYLRYYLLKLEEVDNIEERLFDVEGKKFLMEKTGLKYNYILVIISNLRKQGVIKGNNINMKLLPKLKKGSKVMNVVLSFEYVE